jgi:ribosomal protein S18 acetylase RimI-like enzyme
MIDEAIADPDPAERVALVDALALAFRDNPMNIAIHGPRAGHRVRANRAGLRALVLDSARQTVTRVIRHGGQVAGGFVVVPPGAFPLPAPRVRRLIGSFFHQGARAMDQWSQVAASLGVLHPVTDHWYLAVLGVVPSLHGRGLGTRLVEALLRTVATDPRPIYLESDREASVRFYLGRGFRTVAEVKPLDVTCWCLLRERPGGAGDLCDSVREAGVDEFRV